MIRKSIRIHIATARLTAVSTILMLLGMGIFIAPVAWASSKRIEVTVMSRNLYLGADIFKVVEAAQNPEQGELSVHRAVAEVFATMQHTNFAGRVTAIVDEIEKYKPHLVGLQEVSTILQQVPGDFLAGNPTAAGDVVYDYQTLLLAELAARKLPYEVATVVTNADVELPLLAGVDENGGPVLNDMRLVDHDLILVRKDVSYANPLTQNFSTNISMTLAGSELEFTRGYTVVDAQVKGISFAFVNTHLEVYGGDDDAFSAVQSAQMAELLGILTERQAPVVLLGDFNSPSDAIIIDSAIYDEIVPPYVQITASGYTDLATRSKRTPKFTCCFNETIDDPLAALYEHIDHIFLLPGTAMPKTRLKVIGDRQRDMTTSGLWPSDHAGVVGKFCFYR